MDCDDDAQLSSRYYLTQLMSRDVFRTEVFKRDGGKCVFCGLPAQDAHHIMERRLFPDSGYYLNNGASVCGEHHLACERTDIPVEDVRRACGITEIVLPPHLYRDQQYDKWGNPVMPNGQRLPGELFQDESVQKIIASHLSEFTHYVKYPRTFHLPWSQNISDDDRVMADLSGLEGQEVVVTMKMDGENTSMYSDYFHARSVDSSNHPSRNWAKNLWSRFCGDIPEGWRVCAENLYATHSIHYTDLPSYLMGFSIWDERNWCLDWDNTLEWFELLGIPAVPVLYRGAWDEKRIRDIPINAGTQEGYVVRITASFPYRRFNSVVGKFVRRNHVQTVKHWMTGQPIIPNELALDKKVTAH